MSLRTICLGVGGGCCVIYAVTRPCRHRPSLTALLSLDPRSYAVVPHTVVAGIGQSITRFCQCCRELLVLDLRTIQALVLGGIHPVLVLLELHTGIAQDTYHHYHLEHIWVLIPGPLPQDLVDPGTGLSHRITIGQGSTRCQCVPYQEGSGGSIIVLLVIPP